MRGDGEKSLCDEEGKNPQDWRNVCTASLGACLLSTKKEKKKGRWGKYPGNKKI